MVAHHAFPNSLPGAFVGVDVFFVISGYLISTIIFESLERGTFSFSAFYGRRVRRIFPALLIVLLCCFAFGWFSLLAIEFEQLGKHIAAGAGFVSNLVLWGESGYFDTAAEAKVLLHLWSLGIEEQFYIVWPLLVWAAWRTRLGFPAITILGIAVSFALNVDAVRTDGVAAFYSPQTRFWELLVGALLAYATLRAFHRHDAFVRGIAAKPPGLISEFIARRNDALRDTLSESGAILIAVSLVVINKGRAFPGLWALLPVLGSLAIIAAGRDASFNRVILSNPLLVWFGLISFPLYLWHWPILTFARVIEGGTPDWPVRMVAVAVAILLSSLTYNYIERPFRFGARGKLKVAVLTTLASAIGIVGYETYRSEGLPFNKQALETDAWVDVKKWRTVDNADALCQARIGREFSYCRLDQDSPPTVALIGDSFANSYFPGLSRELAAKGENLVMLGSGGCPPLLNITSGLAGQDDWCASAGTRAIRFVASNSRIHTVILAANWHLYINGNRFHQRYGRAWEIQVVGESGRPPEEVFSRQLRETVEALSIAGKRIIILKQTPEINFDPVRCIGVNPLFRKTVEKCEVPAFLVRAYLAEYEPVLYSALNEDRRVTVVDPYSVFCSETTCTAMVDKRLLYRDDLHLSIYGSNYMARLIVDRLFPK